MSEESWKEDLRAPARELASGNMEKAIPLLAGVVAGAFTQIPLLAGVATGATQFAVAKALAFSVSRRFTEALRTDALETEAARRDRDLAGMISSFLGEALTSLQATEALREAMLDPILQNSDEQFIQLSRIIARSIEPVVATQEVHTEILRNLASRPNTPVSPDAKRNPIMLNVGVFNGDEPHRRVSARYGLENSPSGRSIRPDGPFFYSREACLKYPGSILECAHWIDWVFPTLDVKVLNGGETTVFITDALIEVEISKIDPTPVLIPGPPFDVPPSGPGFKFYNEGWGSAHNLVARYHVSSLDLTDEVAPFEAPFGHLASFEKCEESVDVDLSDALLSAGVQLSKLRTDPRSPFDESLMGRFPNRGRIDHSTTAYGVLVSGTLECDEFEVARRFLARVPVARGQMMQQQQAFLPPSARYSLELRTDGKGYTIWLPVSHVLSEREADRFLIELGVGASSFHKFRVVLKYNDGASVASEPIDLAAFLPRCGSRVVKMRAEWGEDDRERVPAVRRPH